MKKNIPARHAYKAEDYQRLGLQKEIAQWEDGVRTTGKRGEYEWWYFDAKLEGGLSLVIVFFTAPMTALKKGFSPSIMFTLTRADGTVLESGKSYDISQCSFARDRCCAKIGDSVFEGDLKDYRIHFETETVRADVKLHGNAASWRPGTGHIFFGEEDYFAWLPSVPEGSVEAEVTSGGKTETFHGTGYHDHNWGNTGMYRLMHHWYWGRAKIGEYQAITSYITGQEKYGYEHFPIFMLAKNGELLGDDAPNCLTYTQSEPMLVGGKHLFKKLVYDYDDGRQHYRVTYQMEGILEQPGGDKPGPGGGMNPVMKLMMKMMKLEPGYVRVTGTATLEKLEDGLVTEKVEAPALWELMYFGIDKNV